jgi:hypothetical protein
LFAGRVIDMDDLSKSSGNINDGLGLGNESSAFSMDLREANQVDGNIGPWNGSLIARRNFSLAMTRFF